MRCQESEGVRSPEPRPCDDTCCKSESRPSRCVSGKRTPTCCASCWSWSPLDFANHLLSFRSLEDRCTSPHEYRPPPPTETIGHITHDSYRTPPVSQKCLLRQTRLRTDVLFSKCPSPMSLERSESSDVPVSDPPFRVSSLLSFNRPQGIPTSYLLETPSLVTHVLLFLSCILTSPEVPSRSSTFV